MRTESQLRPTIAVDYNRKLLTTQTRDVLCIAFLQLHVSA